MERQYPSSTSTAHSTFGDLLRHLRRQAYMTQRDLALATGYSIGQICRFEQNQCVPDLATLTARFIPALVQASDTTTTEHLLAFADTARAAQRQGQRRSRSLLRISEEPGVGAIPLWHSRSPQRLCLAVSMTLPGYAHCSGRRPCVC